MNVNLIDTIGSNFASKMKSSRNLSIEIVLLIVFSVLFYYFIILPKKAAVDVQNSDLQTLQGQESKMAQALSDLKSLVSGLQNHKDDIAELDEAMPLQNRLNNLQQLIQNLANSLNVAVGNINVSGKSGGIQAGDKALLSNPFGATRTLQTLNASVFVVGSFTQLESFLQKLENNARIMDITSLAIEGGTNGNLNLKVTLNAYYLAPY